MNIYSIVPCGVAKILQFMRLVYLTDDEMQTLQQNLSTVTKHSIRYIKKAHLLIS